MLKWPLRHQLRPVLYSADEHGIGAGATWATITSNLVTRVSLGSVAVPMRQAPLWERTARRQSSNRASWGY